MRSKFFIALALVAGAAFGQQPVLPIPNACCVQPPPQLSAWWTFDQPGSPSHDSIPPDNAATHFGGATIAAGYVNRALCLNGTTAYALVPHDPQVDFTGPCDDFTIDFWLRTEKNMGVGVHTVLDKRTPNPFRGWSVYLYNGRPALQMATGPGNTPVCGGNSADCTNYNATGPIVTDGAWHFVAIRVVRCGTSARGTVIVDGNIVYTFSPRPGSLANTASLNIGRRDPAFGVQYLSGCIDELEISKRALSDAEIFGIFNSGHVGKCRRPLPNAAAAE